MKPYGLRMWHVQLSSPPTRGAWIETALVSCSALPVYVAPHAGGVD